ncbi:hypothetical protein [Rhodococcus sp. UNC363MFTsu5.1]|uniref:hypothetical protein n=1 Tax=Rhodococcus sp. UNC363MFTsu5.1 TaxID=1449069 RepID=UPI000485645C|nr:hypothetical protein [Rhodococcus sp. UNC363MFTsu5.1]
MKRTLIAAVAAAAVPFLLVGCSSDTEEKTSDSAAASTVEELAIGESPQPTGDIYHDTCNGIREYIKTLKDAGITGEGSTPEAIGTEFANLAKAAPDWATKSEQDQKDFQRGVDAGIKGEC